MKTAYLVEVIEDYEAPHLLAVYDNRDAAEDHVAAWNHHHDLEPRMPGWDGDPGWPEYEQAFNAWVLDGINMRVSARGGSCQITEVRVESSYPPACQTGA